MVKCVAPSTWGQIFASRTGHVTLCDWKLSIKEGRSNERHLLWRYNSGGFVLGSCISADHCRPHSHQRAITIGKRRNGTSGVPASGIQECNGISTALEVASRELDFVLTSYYYACAIYIGCSRLHISFEVGGLASAPRDRTIPCYFALLFITGL